MWIAFHHERERVRGAIGAGAERRDNEEKDRRKKNIEGVDSAGVFV
jgi:hypothetical protein